MKVFKEDSGILVKSYVLIANSRASAPRNQ